MGSTRLVPFLVVSLAMAGCAGSTRTTGGVTVPQYEILSERGAGVVQVLVAPGTTKEELLAVDADVFNKKGPDLNVSYFDDRAAAARQFNLQEDIADTDTTFWGHYLAQHNRRRGTDEWAWYGLK